MNIIRSVVYSLLVGFFISHVQAEIHLTDNQKNTLKKIVTSQWFKIGAGTVAIIGCGGTIAWILNHYRKLQVNEVEAGEDEIRKKIIQHIPKLTGSFARSLQVNQLKVDKYCKNGVVDKDAYYQEVQQVITETQATIEERKEGLFLVLTYNERGADNSNPYTTCVCAREPFESNYTLEYRIPRKYMPDEEKERLWCLQQLEELKALKS